LCLVTGNLNHSATSSLGLYQMSVFHSRIQLSWHCPFQQIKAFTSQICFSIKYCSNYKEIVYLFHTD
jgi:hypothetical protein